MHLWRFFQWWIRKLPIQRLCGWGRLFYKSKCLHLCLCFYAKLSNVVGWYAPTSIDRDQSIDRICGISFSGICYICVLLMGLPEAQGFLLGWWVCISQYGCSYSNGKFKICLYRSNTSQWANQNNMQLHLNTLGRNCI